MNFTEDSLSTERFAAFLDGNLPEREMQEVADFIDSHGVYADIVSTAIDIDNDVENITDNADLLPDEILGMDFELPVILESDAPSDDVELLPVGDGPGLTALEDDTDIVTSLPVDTDECDTYANAPESMYDDGSNDYETLDLL